MTLVELRQALFGRDVDVRDSIVLNRITVGALAGWIAMGGDLLGSCTYGPDVLGRAGGARFVLLLATGATLATLLLLAVAYTRMIARFPQAAGGYTAAKHTVGERLALVSGVALVLDAALNVAVSVVTCVRAISDTLPATWHLPQTATAVALVVALTAINLRGVKASVAVLAPVVILFVATHLVVLAAAAARRLDALPATVTAVPTELRESVAQHGAGGTLWKLVLAYAMGGAIYTGMESVSNSVPILREPKVQSARRTMLLLVGVPAALIAAILVNYLLYEVQPTDGRTLNAVLFERFAADVGARPASRPALRFALVTLPLLSEAILLVHAAQTGFVDGPRVLGALATDRLAPRKLARLNRRLAPAPGILLIAATALLTTLLARAALEPLVVAFVVTVFTTFSISQWAMLRHALRRRSERAPWRVDAAVHATALAACVVILVGTIAARWQPALVMVLLIAGGTSFALHVRGRYRAMSSAVAQLDEQLARDPSESPIAIVVLFEERSGFPRVALRWLEAMPLRLSEIVLAGVSRVDAEAVEGQERLRGIERERRLQLDAVADEARRRGLRATVVLRRGADLTETAAALVRDALATAAGPALVVGFRAGAKSSALDPLLREDDAVRLQTRLQRDTIPMIVVSIPLDA